MKKITFTLFIFITFINFTFSQSLNEDFEGGSTTNTWVGDDCNVDAPITNPFKTGINTSNAVLRYGDTGGTYANIRFDTSVKLDLSTKNTFSLKIYVPSAQLTGSQNNQISLKLQNSQLAQPWTTQTEIIKNINIDVWQTVTFNFATDNYINIDASSPNPVNRNDLDRVLLQVNGENNQDQVVAFIDDFTYDGTTNQEEETDFDTLVWSDEFDGSELDKEKWFQQIEPIVNGVSWANNEQQHYTNSDNNAYVTNGSLFIKAKKEKFTYNGSEKEYTSARLNSKFAFKYGKVEVRAKLPSTAGTWPAIWLLGKNIDEDGTYFDQEFGTSPWPFCGEIDIMEPNIAKTEILGTWHWHNGSGHTYNTKHITTTNDDTSNNFHVYSLVWKDDTMKIYMDDTLVNEMETFGAFKEEFFILLNVAMGGNLGGTIDSNFTEDEMEIDYVRVYQKSSSLSVNEEKKKESTLVFPNPVSTIINVKVSDGLVGSKATVYSMLGQSVDSFVQTENVINRNFSKLKSGVYFIVLEKNNLKQKIKFVKK